MALGFFTTISLNILPRSALRTISCSRSSQKSHIIALCARPFQTKNLLIFSTGLGILFLRAYGLSRQKMMVSLISMQIEVYRPFLIFSTSLGRNLHISSVGNFVTTDVTVTDRSMNLILPLRHQEMDPSCHDSSD